MIVEGDWHKQIQTKDTYWTIEESELVLTFNKFNQMEWWSRLLVGEKEINTQKVQPENSKLEDLEPDVR